MTTTATVRLPDGMRVLTHEEMRAVLDAAHTAARRHGVRGHVAEEIAFDVLAVAGVFNQPPKSDPDTCTAQYLPHDAAEFGPDMLGIWQQCEDDPGHEGAHDNGETNWPEGAPGSITPGVSS